ncbi:MAG: [protein-PII] uridylyltransferase [Verrucomicrobiota bacterium]
MPAPVQTAPAFIEAESLASLSPLERLKTLKAWLAENEETLRNNHFAGQLGRANSADRNARTDHLLNTLFKLATSDQTPNIALVANGGYGRGYLNPGSDLDILFLLPKAGHKLAKSDKEFIDRILYPLWDLGFKIGHATRSSNECINQAKDDPHTRTTLFDSRFLAGDTDLFESFKKRFRKDVIDKKLPDFLADRSKDLADRYQKYSHTVFLQEPDVKESPGALRDYHNLIWVCDALFQTRSLQTLHQKGILSERARKELADGFEFLQRVRNDLHYREGNNADILTLRRQGPTADFFAYHEPTLLKRIEALMKNYYWFARHIRQHTETIFEIAELEEARTSRSLFRGPSSQKIEQEFDNFHSRGNRLFANNPEIFQQNPKLLLSLFRLCQKHNLTPSPDLRKLIKAHREDIDDEFRNDLENREVFELILSQRGSVGSTLRLMHRVGILGLWLPEFAPMECLVQHEFFHRYTADEHTLRTIDQLDKLLTSQDHATQQYRELLIKHEDPFALYLALIMHDSGRAMDVEEHIDGSAILTDQVCKRLRITGDRRKLIIFLVDQHLSLFRYATQKDLSDPDVIRNFASQIKNKHNLDSLLIFTYADANGTNEEAWSSWKESLMLQLYKTTRNFLEQGEEEYDRAFREELADTKLRVKRRLENQYLPLVDPHFEHMPKRYFRFRGSRSIRHHLRAIGQHQDRCRRRPDTFFECAVRWLEHPEQGFTELIIAAEDRPGLLRRIACALAAHDVSILSADAFTRSDGIALDLFRVTTSSNQAVTSKMQQLSVVTTLYEISGEIPYNPDDYLVRPKNYLAKKSITEFKVPSRARFHNDDPKYTVIETQSKDRIALLHDILALFDCHQLIITHARICTEKGAALDSFYLADRNGQKLSPELADRLTMELNEILSA